MSMHPLSKWTADGSVCKPFAGDYTLVFPHPTNAHRAYAHMQFKLRTLLHGGSAHKASINPRRYQSVDRTAGKVPCGERTSLDGHG